MNKEVYFAGSIRGGRDDAQLYASIIAYINRTDHVLTEHIGNTEINLKELGRKGDAEIYCRDTEWIRKCDILIAECTNASLGVGYELAYAEKCGKPCYLLYRRSKTQLSAMLAGDPYFMIYPYETESEAYKILDGILSNEKSI